jgi:hypothetical protein
MFMITGTGVHDPPEFMFMISWNRCSPSTGIRVHDPPERALRALMHQKARRATLFACCA